MKRKLTFTSIALAIGLTMSGLSYAETKPELTKEERASLNLEEGWTLADKYASYAYRFWEEQEALKREGKRPDYTDAIDMYKKAAEQGHPLAQSKLGILYSEGEVVPKNYKTAVYWYKKAALQNEPTAQLNLGVLYNNGQGVKRSFVEAYAWHSISAANNSEFMDAETKKLAEKYRDEIETRLSTEYLDKAQALAESYLKKIAQNTK